MEEKMEQTSTPEVKQEVVIEEQPARDKEAETAKVEKLNVWDSLASTFASSIAQAQQRPQSGFEKSVINVIATLSRIGSLTEFDKVVKIGGIPYAIGEFEILEFFSPFVMPCAVKVINDIDAVDLLDRKAFEMKTGRVLTPAELAMANLMIAKSLRIKMKTLNVARESLMLTEAVPYDVKRARVSSKSNGKLCPVRIDTMDRGHYYVPLTDWARYQASKALTVVTGSAEVSKVPKVEVKAETKAVTDKIQPQAQ